MEKQEEIELEGYNIKRIDRQNEGRGIMVAIRKEIGHIVKMIETDKTIGEQMWLDIDNTKVKTRIGIIYGPQESRTLKKDLSKMYKDIGNKVHEAKLEDRAVIIGGDMNAKTGNKIEGNHEKQTKGGKMLINLAEKEGMTIMNTKEVCKGKWTREEAGKKSIIDYVLIDKNYEEAVKEMVIDEQREFTPYKLEGKTERTYTDHNTIMTEINWLWKYSEKKEENKMVMSSENLKKFHKHTSGTELREIWKNENYTVEEKYTKWNEKVMEIAKQTLTQKQKKAKVSKAIRKLRSKRKKLKKEAKNLRDQQERKWSIIRRKYLLDHIINLQKEEERKRTEKIAQEVKQQNGINRNNFWEYLRRRTSRKTEELSEVYDIKGNIQKEPEQIKTAYKEYYTDC